MNTDIHVPGDALKPIVVTLFDEYSKKPWGTVRLRTVDHNVTLYMSRAQLHELSHNIVDALQTADANPYIIDATAPSGEVVVVRPLKCDQCGWPVIVVDGRYKHADPKGVEPDGFYSCAILSAVFAGEACVATVDGRFGVELGMSA